MALIGFDSLREFGLHCLKLGFSTFFIVQGLLLGRAQSSKMQRFRVLGFRGSEVLGLRGLRGLGFNGLEA